MTNNNTKTMEEFTIRAQLSESAQSLDLKSIKSKSINNIFLYV